MSRRVQAWLMFLVLGLVLPLAGTPLSYCLCSNSVTPPGNTCPHCCQDCADDGNPGHPPPCGHDDCCVPVDLIPDALPQGDLELPLPDVLDLPREAPVTAGLLAFPSGANHSWFCYRGPPPGPPRYLSLCSLLL